jgi:hypothetical protein
MYREVSLMLFPQCNAAKKLISPNNYRVVWHETQTHTPIGKWMCLTVHLEPSPETEEEDREV